jgi:3-isopropylmalate/(R)-2-methylmalate dehydratase large subunit
VSVRPDLVLGHEATIALLIDRLHATGRDVFDPDRCFFAADHFVPPATVERADILRKYLSFIEQQGIPDDLLYRGISHQLLVEDSRCRPGALIVGADSHTTMGGALSCFSAGFGSTDILAVLATGHVFVRIPEAVKVTFVGERPPGLSGKDVALEMMRRFGESGARYQALEFIDRSSGLTMADRMTVTNMAVDCGAKNGLFLMDSVTEDYVQKRDGEVDPALEQWSKPGSPDAYVQELEIDIAALTPLVARPGSPADVVPANKARSEAVHQVFVGSCCGGRLSDLREAADVLRGQSVRRGVRMIVTPASQRVYQEALKEGVIADLVDAGVMVTASACGACGGIDKGILGGGEVCVSTSNRNFRGRMGSVDARIWLASARTAAACALTGEITDPRTLL